MSYFGEKEREGRAREEGAQEGVATAQATDLPVGDVVDVRDVGGGVVGQRVALEVTPEQLYRIEFRGVGRQELEMDGPAAPQEAPDDVSAVGVETVPDHDEGPLDLAAQVAEELHDIGGGEIGVGQELKVQPDPLALGGHGEGRNGRDLVAGAGPLGDSRGDTTRGPGASHERGHQEPALVDEHEQGVQRTGFFLMRGHSTRTQRRIAASSRSRACRSGFCGVQPKARSTRPIWST